MKKKRGGSLRVKMLASILPFIVIAMVLLTWISASTSSSIINEQISDRMTAELNANMNEINADLNVVRSTASDLAATVSGTYTTTSMAESISALVMPALGSSMFRITFLPAAFLKIKSRSVSELIVVSSLF